MSYTATNTILITDNYTITQNYYGNYTAQHGTTCFKIPSTTINKTIINNFVILGGGGNRIGNGGNGLDNSSNNISIFNYGSFLGGGGGGNGIYVTAAKGAGGPGGGGGGSNYGDNNQHMAGNGGSFISNINGSDGEFRGGGGGGASNGIGGLCPAGGSRGGAGGKYNNGIYIGGNASIPNNTSGSGGGYGGGNGMGGAGGGGGGGIGGGGYGGYSIYNTGTIVNLYNQQGGNNIYGPLFYAGTLPTNYYIRINSLESYGQLFCKGWAWSSSPNGNTMNIYIDPSSSFTGDGILNKVYTLPVVFSGITFTTLPSGTNTNKYCNYTWRIVLNGSNYDLQFTITNWLTTIYPTYISNPMSSSYRHVAITISSNILTLYLDGSAIAVNPLKSFFNYYPSTISKLSIGSAADLSYGYTGYIDDFKVFNRALPPSDISAIYYNL